MTDTPMLTSIRSKWRASSVKHRRNVAMAILGIIFLLLGLIFGIYWLFIGRFEVYTDDAYVNGNIVALMPQVSGTVIQINTDDTHLVLQGQTVIQLDPTDRIIALQRAKADLANRVRTVNQYYKNAQQAQQILILRHADLLQAQLDLKRRVGLMGERAISREELQHYRTALEAANARYQSALYILRARMGLVENAHLYTHPQVEEAKANVNKAYLDLARTIIVAPVTGYVAKRSVQVGQQVNLRTPMLAIVPLNEVWVDANYKESQLSPLRVGQPVTLYADAYSDVTYHGKVVGLNAGTGAAFSILPPQNATGNWIKIVQRLPVRISLDVNELKQQPLQIGLSMHVTVDVHQTEGQRMGTVVTQKPVYVTDVYANQLADANTLIDGILHENASDIFLPRLGNDQGVLS